MTAAARMADQLQDAVIRLREVRLTYANSARVRSERLIDPWGLVDKDETWYLIAGTEQGQRTFRVDRILEAEPTDQRAARPDDFALASAWEQVVGEVEQRRSRTWATVLIEARFVPVLRDHFGRHCHASSKTRATDAPESASPHPPRSTSPGTWPGGAP